MRELSHLIFKIGEEEHIDVLRFTHASPFGDYSLANSPRRDPKLSLPSARSIIVCGIYIGGFLLPDWEKPGIGKTSRLFLSGFYADVVTPLKRIIDVLDARGYNSIICDTSNPDSSVLPVKLAAVRAGIGWQGKNTLVISPQYGSFLALGGIITEAPLRADGSVETNKCGKCRKCQLACPTGALEEPYNLNRSKCLSHILETDADCDALAAQIGNKIIECEICQEACPWNRRHIKQPMLTERIKGFRHRERMVQDFFSLENLASLSLGDFRGFIKEYRLEFDYGLFMRNVKIAKDNYEDKKRICQK
jgi:epoxyqueuosine reductase